MVRSVMSDDNLGEESPEDDNAQNGEPAAGTENEEPVADGEADDGPEAAKLKKARLDAVLRKYRATLRNEAEAGNEGFSLDYYKEQKPPHW